MLPGIGITVDELTNLADESSTSKYNLAKGWEKNVVKLRKKKEISVFSEDSLSEGDIS